jgi:hypothetical protein
MRLNLAYYQNNYLSKNYNNNNNNNNNNNSDQTIIFTFSTTHAVPKMKKYIIFTNTTDDQTITQ